MYKKLNKEEELKFRQWARDNYSPMEHDIKATWHPVIVDECNKIKQEFFNYPISNDTTV
jgi:hypothetical protein